MQIEINPHDIWGNNTFSKDKAANYNQKINQKHAHFMSDRRELFSKKE